MGGEKASVWRAKPLKVKKKVKSGVVAPPKEIEGKKWAMVQLTVQGERCKSWRSILDSLRDALGNLVDAYYPGIWCDDDFDDRAELLSGYLFVEHIESNTYSSLYDIKEQRNHYFKGVVHNKDKNIPETISNEKLSKTKKDVTEKLIPVIEPGTHIKIQRGDWRKSRAFIEAVARNGMVVCRVRTTEKTLRMILPKECFARDPDTEQKE